jgi:hypothetical protein
MTVGWKIGVMSLDQRFHESEAAHRTQSFSEVVERYSPPFSVLANHEHEFHVKALAVEGEMCHTANAQTQACTLGAPSNWVRG